MNKDNFYLVNIASKISEEVFYLTEQANRRLSRLEGQLAEAREYGELMLQLFDKLSNGGKVPFRPNPPWEVMP